MRNINSVNPSDMRRYMYDKIKKENNSSIKMNKSKNNKSLKEINEININDDDKFIYDYLNNEDFEDVEEHLEKTPIPFNNQLESFKPNYKKNINNINKSSNNNIINDNKNVMQFPYIPYTEKKKNENLNSNSNKSYQKVLLEKKEKIFDDEINNLNLKEDIIEEKINYNSNNNNNLKDNNNYNNYNNLNNINDEEIIDIFEEGENIISEHMNIVKREAILLSEEGKLISKIKGIDNKNNFNMEDYTPNLENIINEKIELYKELKKRIQEYKKVSKE